jgi:hypothetical protein
VHFTAAEIAKLAEDYLNQHGAELIVQAKERIERSPAFARLRCANLSSTAQPSDA